MMNSKPPTQPGATFLTNKQAAEILEKLKVIKGMDGKPIKISTIQTNPQTGVKKIVAIPIHSGPSANGMGGPNLSISPMKTSGSPVLTPGRTIKINSPRSSGGFSNVSLVRAVPSSVSSSGVSLQQHQHVAMSTAGIIKLPSHTLIQASSASSQPILSSQATVMSRQRVTLTPQKPVLSLSNANTNYTRNSSVGSTSATYTSLTGSSSNMTLASSHHTRAIELGEFISAKRPLDIDSAEMSEAKRRKTEKGGKGLRHFSMKVCEKVKMKGTTSYNEVADELVAELTDPRNQSPSDPTYDQKNIRRRVYDALNVLMAMNIISKEKKEIRWLGLPTNSVQEATALETDKAERLQRIKLKTKQLQDLILQQIAFKNLVERNREAEKSSGGPTPNSAIQLPFIIVGTSKRTVIDCSISNDKMEYLFNFDNTFEIHDDMEVLKKMKMTMGLENGSISTEELRRAKNMVPRSLQSYVEEMAKQGVNSCNTLTPKVSEPIIKTETDSLSTLETLEPGLEEDSDD